MSNNASHTDNRRIARNTLLLYVRSFITMAIGLYTSRKILQALGADDYGLFNVVGGIIVMLSFINSSITTGIQRYLTVDLGHRDLQAYNRTFNISLIIQGALCILILILAETIGLWFLNTRIHIDPTRLHAANIVFQAAILTTVISLLSTPYTATITSHERMGTYAAIGLTEAAAKLAIVLLLFHLPWDRLTTWAILLVAISIASGLIQAIYCHRHFTHCRLNLRLDRRLLRSMLNFSGWNLFGSLAWTAKDQGINILLNIFSASTSVNAARAIAMQIRGAVATLTGGFQNAFSPQLIKNAAAKNLQATTDLLFTGSRISYYLLLIIAIPVVFEATFILNFWLIDVPAYATLFTTLVIIEILADIFSGPFIQILLADGRIRNYQIAVGLILLLNLPVSYFLLSLHLPIYVPFIVSITLVILAQTLRILFARHLIGIPLRPYLFGVIARCLLVTAISIIPPAIIFFSLPDGWLRLIILTLVSIIFTGLTIWLIGLNRAERGLIRQYIRSRLHPTRPSNPSA